MGALWTVIAVFLYTEIAFCCLLLFPVLSASRWKKIFSSRWITTIYSYTYFYINVFILFLVCMIIASMRDYMYKFVPGGIGASVDPETVFHRRMKMFRAHRNFYIAFFAVTLFMVIRRLITQICRAAILTELAEAKMSTDPKERNASEISRELHKTQRDAEILKQEIRTIKEESDTLQKRYLITREEYQALKLDHESAQKKLQLEKDTTNPVV